MYPFIIGAYATRCDFSQGPCDWTQSTEDDFNWLRRRGKHLLQFVLERDTTHGSSLPLTNVSLKVFLYISGATASWNTGPPSDHTTQNGYYMYIETSWPRKYGDKAWMVSRNFQAIPPGSAPCKLRFFYHMYGDSAETLSVYIRNYQNGTAQIKVWSQVGSQGAVWNRAVVQLSSNKNFQV